MSHTTEETVAGWLAGDVRFSEVFLSHTAIRRAPFPLEMAIIDRFERELVRAGATKDVHITAVQPDWHRQVFGEMEEPDSERWFAWGWRK